MQVLPAEDASAIFPPLALPSQLRTDRSRPACALTYIARRMGKEDRTLPWLMGYLRQLIRNHGFPPPFTVRLYKGEMLTGWQAVARDARWYKAPVDAWLDGLLPSHILVAVEEAEIAAHAETLDARAAVLCMPRRRGNA